MREYANPYADVEVTVTFTGPHGVVIPRPAFWDGGTVWKVRFAPTMLGDWQWRSACSDSTNAGLHGKTGQLTCVPATGNNPNYQHGFLMLSANHRYFTYADGTPFFWLGDTHWMMPNTERVEVCNHPEHQGKACPFGGQFQHLVADRKVKGFNVYQTYPSAANAAWWTSPFTQLNPERFNTVFDVQINHLAEQGFIIALGCGHFNESMQIPVADLRRWARYLVARYGAHPVVWVTAQEVNAPEDNGQNCLAAWKAVAEEIERVDGYQHPHSAHQWVVDVATRLLGHEHWHDWFALQGGHVNSGLTPQARYAGYFNFQPTKPVIETEAMYELIDCGGVADVDDARRAAWKALLCGCAGYTYGAAGVWALKWDAMDSQWKDYNYRIESWYAGMTLPGATQMSLLQKFFSELSWWQLTPRFTDPCWASWEEAESCVLASDGNKLYVVYCYGTTCRGTLMQLDISATYTAHWYNPRTGEQTLIATGISSKDGEWCVPEKAEGDWVLVLRVNCR